MITKYIYVDLAVHVISDCNKIHSLHIPDMTFLESSSLCFFTHYFYVRSINLQYINIVIMTFASAGYNKTLNFKLI